MKPNDIIKERLALMSEKITLDEAIEKIENQLAWLPFYAEYIELKKALTLKEKDIKSVETDLFKTMTTENIDKVVHWELVYIVAESSKPSISVDDSLDYPEEAYTNTLLPKTKLLELSNKFKEEWKWFDWITTVFKKSLKILPNN